MKSVIVQGSARSFGNTHQIVQLIQQQMECDLIDLKTYEIRSFDYENRNQKDDFVALINRLTEYDFLLFATPVYWYSMSGLMKNFFDRITDCLMFEKDTGRRLRGMRMAAMACGSDRNEDEGFFVPFEKSAAYLGMHYLGHIHTWIERDKPEETVIVRVNDFVNRIKEY